MYVSRAVRSIREHPVPDATVMLLVEVAEDVPTRRVREDLAAIEGVAVADELAFDTLQVRAPQERVDDVCAVDGLAAVETDATLTVDAGGAGEDVEF